MRIAAWFAGEAIDFAERGFRLLQDFIGADQRAFGIGVQLHHKMLFRLVPGEPETERDRQQNAE